MSHHNESRLGYSLATITWKSESEDMPVTIRSPTNCDKYFLCRISGAMPGVFGIPHDGGAAYPNTSLELVRAWKEEQRTPMIVQDGKAMAGPTQFHLFIVPSTNERSLAYGICGYGDIVTEDSWGGQSRAATLHFWVDEDNTRIKELTEGALKLLLEFGLTDASDGGLQLDRIRVLARDDQKAGLAIITNKLSLPLAEATMVAGPAPAMGEAEWYAWDLTREEALSRLPRSVRNRDPIPPLPLLRRDHR